MSYVILARNPSNGAIIAIAESGDLESLAQFDTEEEAEALARTHLICQAWPYIIVEAP